MRSCCLREVGGKGGLRTLVRLGPLEARRGEAYPEALLADVHMCCRQLIGQQLARVAFRAEPQDGVEAREAHLAIFIHEELEQPL